MWFKIIESIKTQQRSIALQAIATNSLFVVIIIGILVHQGTPLTGGLGLALIAMVVTPVVFFWVMYSIPGYVFREARKLYGDRLAGEPENNDNPWDLQRDLMKASGQACPPLPRFTNGTVLYSALIMEEVGETFMEISDILSAYASSPEFEKALGGGRASIHQLIVHRNQFADLAAQLNKTSVSIRTSLQSTTYDFDLTQEQAKPLLDGTTDVAVVNCGFALATGLPGSAAYHEVVTSNLSKRNPATGKIDKTPDGKWIKGVNYQPPNLDIVLYAQRAGFEWNADRV